jgi:hypothetical protein
MGRPACVRWTLPFYRSKSYVSVIAPPGVLISTLHPSNRSPTLRGGEGTALTMWPNGLSALGAIDAELLKKVSLFCMPAD